ncbi:cytochrome P450 9e2-like [Arctopsyche grandis]|uniref:cytochrome P450 9e2-like n=1 Tax=Arctopsyche grandis TaxID=121162 RepID=UPI00406D9ECB
MAFNWWDAFLLAIGFVVIFSAYGYWENGYFKRRGIKNIPFYFPIVGNTFQTLIGKEHFMDLIFKVYNAFPNEKYVGFMAVNEGIIMLKDLEIIKNVTIRNFENFPSHAANIDESFDPIIGRNLLFITGDEWKDMRATVSPAFTSSKLRKMMSLVDETGKQIVDFYSSKMSESENKERGLIEVEMGDVFSRYTNDVIASTVYGVTVNSLIERHNEFYNMGIKTYDLTGILLFKLIVYFSFPFLIRISGVQFLPKKLSDFFRNLVSGTMKYREENGITRPDMIQMLMEARKGSLKYDVSHNESNDAGFATVVESAIGKQTNKREWTENDIVAQALVFFIAGFETTKTLLTFAIHKLTVNPDIQKTLQIEIDELIAEKGDGLDYSNLMQMKYMDMVVCEALRKWPPVPVTDRKCIRSFNLPPPNNSSNKEFTIQAGEGILIPIHAIHHDPQYYPDPEKFDPERFSTENKTNINPLSFLPFGVGPRNCIGSRYALMITKSIIFQLLSKFDFVMTAKTQNLIKINSKSLTLIPKDGVWAGLKPRNG